MGNLGLFIITTRKRDPFEAYNALTTWQKHVNMATVVQDMNIIDIPIAYYCVLSAPLNTDVNLVFAFHLLDL